MRKLLDHRHRDWSRRSTTTQRRQPSGLLATSAVPPGEKRGPFRGGLREGQEGNLGVPLLYGWIGGTVRIAVIGATGLIGGRLARSLLGSGHQVVLIARGLTRGNEDLLNHPSARFHPIDISNGSA